jgi:DNA polymerase-3 subunit gamma/tau
LISEKAACNAGCFFFAIIGFMSELALYRKYRPQSFKDVVDQEQAVSVLESEIKNSSISHAYLFSGSRGTGKTSVARIFAREIGTSENDLYEIDAASNRGIDDIREIRESVNTLPFESKYKVYIVDEVHMLTKEAFNALLKTLEEPPSHVVFILATTEEEKLPETVVSRCERFTFKKPNQEVLKKVVLETAKKEGTGLDPAGAELIALMGDGSFRDTLGVLQKVLTSVSGSKKITLEEIEKIIGAPKNSLLNAVVTGIGEKKLDAALTALSKAADANIDMAVFAKLLIQKIRFILLLRYAPEMEGHIKGEVTEEDFTFLKKLASEQSSLINSASLSELLLATDTIGRSAIPQLPLELALIKILGNIS